MAVLNAREVKNKVISRLPENERNDAIVGQTNQGGFLIVTNSRAIEVYTTGDSIYVQERDFDYGGWETFPVDMEGVN